MTKLEPNMTQMFYVYFVFKTQPKSQSLVGFQPMKMVKPSTGKCIWKLSKEWQILYQSSRYISYAAGGGPGSDPEATLLVIHASLELEFTKFGLKTIMFLLVWETRDSSLLEPIMPI